MFGYLSQIKYWMCIIILGWHHTAQKKWTCAHILYHVQICRIILVRLLLLFHSVQAKIMPSSQLPEQDATQQRHRQPDMQYKYSRNRKYTKQYGDIFEHWSYVDCTTPSQLGRGVARSGYQYLREAIKKSGLVMEIFRKGV